MTKRYEITQYTYTFRNQQQISYNKPTINAYAPMIRSSTSTKRGNESRRSIA